MVSQLTPGRNFYSRPRRKPAMHNSQFFCSKQIVFIFCWIRSGFCCFSIRSAQIPGFPRVGHFLRHPVQLLFDWNKLPLCTYLIELCAYIWRKCMNDLLGTRRCPGFQSMGIFWDTLYHCQKWDCLQIYYVIDVVDTDSLGAKKLAFVAFYTPLILSKPGQ